MADIVKLIYKGDEMAQGGGSSNPSVKFYELTESNFDLSVWQQILNDLKDGIYPIIKLMNSDSNYIQYDIYYLNYWFEKESWTWSSNTRITFYHYQIDDDSTTWDPSLIIKWTDSQVHIQQYFLRIYYTWSLSWTPIISDINTSRNEFAITWIYWW